MMLSFAGTKQIQFSATDVQRIGVISDTHNLLRPEAVEELQGVDLIIHAGDIGERRILEELETIAPVVAVRGNVDTAAWCAEIPLTQMIAVGDVRIYVIHNLKELNIDPPAEKLQAVISGHSHKPVTTDRENILFLNPGSAGRRRFKLPITLAKLEIKNSQIKAHIVDLEMRPNK